MWFITGLLISITSCSISGYRPLTNPNDKEIVDLFVFNEGFQKVIYKTNIDIYSNNLTGITLIKKTDSAYRVVSMSELGLKYFDIEFPFDKTKLSVIHYIMEPLNKKLLVNMLIKDFSLLFYPPDSESSNIMISEETNNFLAKQNKLIYMFNSSGTIHEIGKKNCSGKVKPIVNLSGYQKSSPGTINIDHRKITLEFEVVD